MVGAIRLRNKTRKLHRLPKNMGTTMGLSDSHTRLIEQLGWMVLAKEKGMDYKVSAYKKSIDQFLKSVKHVMSEYEEHNRKHDLNVLYRQMECLKDFVDKNL